MPIARLTYNPSAIAPQSLTVTAPLTLTANFTPDFALSISTPPPTPINGTVQFTVTVTGFNDPVTRQNNGFNDAVTLDAPLLPTGATFTPLTVHGPGSYTVTIHAPLTGGTFAFTLRGTAGPASSGLTHGVAGTLAVQDFTVNPLTQLLSGGPNDTVKYVFAIAPLGGFNGIVTGTYKGMTANNPPIGGEYCSQSSASAEPGASTVTVSITIASPCSLWTFDVSMQFASGTISHTVVVQLQGVATGLFTLSTPSPPPTATNNQVTLPIQVTSKFNGQTVLFLPNMMTAGCGTVSGLPAYVSAPGSLSLTVDTTGCPLGTWNVIVTGQDGTVTQSLALPYVVGPYTTPPDFSIQPTPSTLTIAPGASGLYTLNVASLYGFTQTVTLAPGTLPTGVTAAFPAGSTVNGAGTASLRVAADTTATPGTYTITVTGTAAQLAPRAATLTLNIVAPPAGTGFTFANLPTVTIPADGTVVPASIAVTPLNGSTATIALQSNSTLPLGINATISGHTLILSAAAGVPAGDYNLDLIGNDGTGGDGSGNTSHGRCPVHVGGSGDGFGTPYLIVPSQIGVPNNGQSTRIGPYWILSIGGLLEYYSPPAAEVTTCSAGAGITADIVMPSQSAPSNIREFDIIYTAPGTTPGDLTVTCTVQGHSAAPVPPAVGVSVYQVTSPQLSGPTQISVLNNNQAVVSGPYYVYGSSTTTNLAASNVACQALPSGHGVSLTVAWPSKSDPYEPTSFDLTFTASTSAAGSSTVSCTWGAVAVVPETTPVTVTVYNPSPQIFSVTPDSWPAGSATNFLITGVGFGTSPNLAISGTVIDSLTYSCGNPCDTTISGTIRISSSAPAGTAALTVSSNGYAGQAFIGQTGQSASGTATVPVIPVGSPAFSLNVTADGTPVTGGSTVYITQAPVMPALVANLVAAQGATLSGNVSWQVVFHYNTAGSYDWSDTVPAQPRTLSDLSAWNISGDMSGVAGGNATMAYVYGSYTGTFKFQVLGTNPTPDMVRSRLGADPWFLQQLVNHESGYLQFNEKGTRGTPNFGPPNGFGIMQLDPPDSSFQIWDWTQNVDAGKLRLNNFYLDDFWAHQVTAWSDFNDAHPSVAVMPPTDEPEGPCVFSMNPNGSAHSFSDAIWIKRYNTGNGGVPYIQFNAYTDPTTQTPRGIWLKNPLSSWVNKATKQLKGQWDYVALVCSTPQ